MLQLQQTLALFILAILAIIQTVESLPPPALPDRCTTPCAHIAQTSGAKCQAPSFCINVYPPHEKCAVAMCNGTPVDEPEPQEVEL
jgi:hypothetical protein